MIMKEEIREWDRDWDDEDDEATYNEAWRRLRFWSEMKARGCHYTIITPYYNIEDGMIVPKPMPKRDIEMMKKMFQKNREMREQLRKEFSELRKKCDENPELDIHEEWQKRLHQLRAGK